MAPEDARLVTYAWKRIGSHSDHAAGLFYDRLFEIAPTTHAHVSVELMPACRRDLMAGIDWAVGEIARERPGTLPGPLALRDPFLGAGTDQVVAALLWTLHTVLGRDWTPRHEAAWRAAGPAIVAALRPHPSSA
ncbi:hypothetical protein GXW74_23770 [Roseomonas eburnea]|uniref:Globin n=1 Tax=Neoroseomonas eburnea TaxID=1346889 RepID=A0A9X9XII8_9PROT|nr:hypothetical protein [Neoroseomonas eburnea]MBR0683524.1 hypothetical protein [Neoroseomonas eburnea]